MASIAQKDERQYAGTQYKTSEPTPPEELLDKYSDESNFSDDVLGKQTVKYYSHKLKSLDLSCDFAKLTSGSSPEDILMTASLILDFVVAKNNK